MSAFLSQVKENVSIADLPELLNTVLSYVTTSVDVDMAIRIGSQALGYSLENVTMMTAKGGPYKESADFYVLNHDALLHALQEHYNVFEKEIPVLDPNGIFTDPENENPGAYGTTIDEIYRAVGVTLDEMDAEDINKDGIDIQEKK